MGSEAGAVEQLLARNGGVAVIDGGLATQLEALGAVFNDPLWSALCLIRDPHLIKQVFISYSGRMYAVILDVVHLSI